MLKMSEIIKEKIGIESIIDKILSEKLQYSELTPEQRSLIYGEGWFLIREYKINLNDIYKDVMKNIDVYGIFYSFRDKKNKLHYTRISKDNVVKIGPAVDNFNVDGHILTQKNRKFNDDMLLNTHIANVIKYVNEYHPKELLVNIETSDNHGEGRKRLFLGIAGKLNDLVKDVKISKDGMIVYLNYKMEK